MKKFFIFLCLIVISATVPCSHVNAEQFKIAIMQDNKDEAQKYRPLVEYLKKKGIDAALVGTSSYTAAANMFADGKADAMFSGSGVAGSMMIKNVAYPVVRPLGNDGTSTYWAVILAPKGSAKYKGSPDYFSGKKVIFCSLASSGEFYLHSIGGHKTAAGLMKAASHGAAIDALSKEVANVAIVKNRVWDKSKDKYPDLEVVGMDKGENPDNTLIIAKTTNKELSDRVKSYLLALKEDASEEAKAVREEMKIQGFIETKESDFSHTISLLKSAGVTASFDFSY